MTLVEVAKQRLADFASKADGGTTKQLELLEQYRRYMASKPFSVSEILEALEDVSQGKDYSLGQMVIVAAYYQPSPRYVDVLCTILASEKLDKLHENVCGLLGDIGDERAIPCLRQALSYRWDWDLGLEIPISALSALASIDTASARAVIASVAESGPPQLQQEAAELLK
jgi:hypothetical protein